MSDVTLLVTAGASLAAACAFALVGWQLARRPYASDVQLVGFAFVAWWFLFAAMALTDGLRVVLGVFDTQFHTVYLALVRIKIVAAAAAIWALGYYVVYLWTGSSRWGPALAGFAFAHGFYYLYALELREPLGFTTGTWSTRLALGEGAVLPAPLSALALFFFFAPFLGLAVGYLAMVTRLPTRTQRYRVAAIALVVLVWHVTAFVQFDPTTSAETPLFPLFALLNAGAAVLALAAYHPPAWLHDRLGIQDHAEEQDRSPAEIERGARPRAH